MNFRYLILDLDNTLYPQCSGMLQMIDRRIDQFIAATTAIPTERIPEVRQEYLCEYGTTIGGLVMHHRIDPADYFAFAYDIDVTQFVKPDSELAAVLQKLALAEIVFSNSPLEYVERVLAVLGIRQIINKVYDIHFSRLVGKPNLSSYQRVLSDLRAEGDECIFVDDVAANLSGAAAAGMTPVLMRTVHVHGHGPGDGWAVSRIHDLSQLVPEIIRARRTA